MKTRIALAVALLGIAVGCGYHTGGHADLMPKGVHTIAIPAFKNITTHYKLTGLVPQEIAREFNTRTHYRIIADATQADAVLEGSITRIYVAPTIIDPSMGGRASGSQLYVWMNLTLRERATGKELWKRTGMELHERYEMTGDQLSYIDESDAALARMSRALARQVVSSILEAW